MKKTIKFLWVIVLVTVIGFSMVSCGTDDSPKGLAKQGVKLSIKMAEESKYQDVLKKYEKDLKELDNKYAKLSPEDQKIYNKEVQRLLEEEKKKLIK